MTHTERLILLADLNKPKHKRAVAHIIEKPTAYSRPRPTYYRHGRKPRKQVNPLAHLLTGVLIVVVGAVVVRYL